MNNPGRAAMQSRNGSWGTKMRNNIFINDQPSSIEIFNTSIYQVDSSFNVINTLSYTNMNSALKHLARVLPEGAQTTADITLEKAAQEFVRYSNEPWIIISGNWWQLNPNKPDFRPRADSKLFANWGDSQELPPRDLEGRKRLDRSIGALVPERPAN
jgi:hypothetical protein